MAGIHVTGLGIVSAIGKSVEQNLNSLLECRSGIGTATYLKERDGLLVGEVKMSNEEIIGLNQLSDKLLSRTTLLGLMAAKEAWHDNENTGELRTGFISATSVSGMDRSEDFYKDYLNIQSPDFNILKYHDSGNTSERIAKELGISGYINTISTACSSAANAMMLGARLIEQGRLDRVLVGGVDPLTKFTVAGFRSLMIYDDAWCRPFDETRAGLNLGEGAAFLVLENEKSLKLTGHKTRCYLKGWANAADAYHQTASSPDGKGATLAILNALKKANLAHEDIDYINAHGTGTKNNDLSESVAIQNVFGKDIPAFSSTKSFTGHTLAAAGAIEAVFSILAIENNVIFPNLNYTTAIEETGLIPIHGAVLSKEVNTVLSNSFGFGGNNSSLIFSRGY